MVEPTTLNAADACAVETLERLERMSPLAAQSLQGPMRSVVLAAMGLCFTEGTIYGAKRIVERVTNI
jgi:hypothetical protein